jgi:mono/diheme cytochrome c family protein
MKKTLLVLGVVIAIVAIFSGGVLLGQVRPNMTGMISSSSNVNDTEPSTVAEAETAVQPPTTGTANTTQQTNDWDAATFFATTCASCHGPTGEGSAIAPSLNREEIRTADTDWLIETISYGRPGTAMPAWSVEAGGPLSSDQIAEMAAFLQAGEWEKAGEIAAEQPIPPMGPGMMGHGMMGHGMMGNGGMMGRGMGGGMMGGRQP